MLQGPQTFISHLNRAVNSLRAFAETHAAYSSDERWGPFLNRVQSLTAKLSSSLTRKEQLGAVSEFLKDIDPGRVNNGPFQSVYRSLADLKAAAERLEKITGTQLRGTLHPLFKPPSIRPPAAALAGTDQDTEPPPSRLGPAHPLANEEGFLWERRPVQTETGTTEDRPVLTSYRLIRTQTGDFQTIGGGSFGKIYRAERIRGNEVLEEVAIKILSPQETHGGLEARMALNETMIQMRLDKKTAVVVHDFGTTARGELFIVMEIVKGGDLRKQIDLLHQEKGQFDVKKVLSLAVDILAAATDIFERGVLHRDLKPENILIGESGVQICDFGIAGLLTQGHYVDAGSLPYFVYVEKDSPQRDVFALGVILYELLTGQLPWQGIKEAIEDFGNAMEKRDSLEIDRTSVAFLKALNSDPIPFESVVPKLRLPPEVEEVVRRALSFDRETRQKDPAQLLFEFLTWEARKTEKAAGQAVTPGDKERLLSRALAGYEAAHKRRPMPLIEEALARVAFGRYDLAQKKGDDPLREEMAAKTGLHDRAGRHVGQLQEKLSFRFKIDDRRLPPGIHPLLLLTRLEDRGGVLQSVENVWVQNPAEILHLTRGPYKITAIFCTAKNGSWRPHGGIRPVARPLPPRPSETGEPVVIEIPVFYDSEVPDGFVVVPRGVAAVRTHEDESIRYSGKIPPERLRPVDHHFALKPKITNQEMLTGLEKISKKDRALAIRCLPPHWHANVGQKLGRGLQITANDLIGKNNSLLNPDAAVTISSYETGLAFIRALYGEKARYPTPDECRLFSRGDMDFKRYSWGDNPNPWTHQRANRSADQVFVAWRYMGDFTSPEVPANNQPSIIDRSPYSVEALEEAGLGTNVIVPWPLSGTYVFLDNNDPQRFFQIDPAIDQLYRTLLILSSKKTELQDFLDKHPLLGGQPASHTVPLFPDELRIQDPNNPEMQAAMMVVIPL